MVTDTTQTLSGNTSQHEGAGHAGNGSRDAETGATTNAPELLNSLTEGAHQTIDRLAERVTPHVQRLQESLSSGTEKLDERADQLRELTDEWIEALRSTVRENPLAAVGAALALGLLVARLSR